MNVPSRWSVCAGVGAAVMVGLFLLSPGWIADRDPPQRAGAPPDDAPDEELERQRLALLRHIEAKRAVARELVAERLTLREAAARFRDLDRDAPEIYWRGFPYLYPGRSEAERYCRQVIDCVEGELGLTVEGGSRAQPGVAAIAARLRQELDQHLAAGTLTLPE